MSGGDLVGVPEPGDVIADKYRLERVIGKGAAGVVFEATHELIGRRVALKWLYPHLAFNETVAKRFLREARAANVVDHPGVVEIYDASHEGDALYLVMELLRGEPLSSFIERGIEDPEELVQVLMPALRGIAAAHDHGVIHRDLKPDNIFLSAPRRGRPGGAKVLDFGISKLREQDRSAPLTSAGTYLGSPYYMAPEQIADSSTVDARADVYSIGVILYQGLTGEVPYDADSLSGLFLKITNEKPTPIAALRPNVSDALVTVVMRAMSPRPEERYASVKMLAKALEPFAGGAVFATLDEALGDALGDAISRRVKLPRLDDDESDARDSDADARDSDEGARDSDGEGDMEQAPTMVSAGVGRELRDSQRPRAGEEDDDQDDQDDVDGLGLGDRGMGARSTLINFTKRDTNPEERDTDPPAKGASGADGSAEDRDTDPTKTPLEGSLQAPKLAPAPPPVSAPPPPPPASRALAALRGQPIVGDLDASPTMPLIKIDDVEGRPSGSSGASGASADTHAANTANTGRPAQIIDVSTAKTFEMQRPNWDETSMVGRKLNPPPALARKIPWAAIIGAGLIVTILCVTLYVVTMR